MKQMIILWMMGILLSWVPQAWGQETETLVQIDTDMGKIKVKLYNDTPLHRDNFIKLVKDNFYDGLLFHRVIKQFMIQGGAASSKTAAMDEAITDGDSAYTIPAEIHYPQHFHRRGTLCAARQPAEYNPDKASSCSQFYIVTGKFFTAMELDKQEKEGKHAPFTPEEREAYMLEGGAPHLDGAYTIFGEVVQGMKVVDKIQFVETNENDRPLKNIKIRSMKIVEK